MIMKKVLNTENEISTGAGGSPHSRACACATLYLAPHRHQRTMLAYMSGRGDTI